MKVGKRTSKSNFCGACGGRGYWNRPDHGPERCLICKGTGTLPPLLRWNEEQ